MIVGPTVGPNAVNVTPGAGYVVEITIAIALLFPFSAAYATLASATLFAMFVTVLTIAFFQDKDTPCGCFGASSQERITGLTIGRAGLFFGIDTFASKLP
jgi:hypothetical protein